MVRPPPCWHYQLQSSTDMATWEAVPGASFVGDGNVMQFSGMQLPTALDPALFYRVEITAP